jgi:hypothetical protein
MAGAAESANVARYGGASQRQALLNRIGEAGGLREAKGIVHAFREMKRLGFALEDVSLAYRGRHGVDLVFSKAGRYAITEAKHGNSLSLFKTYKGGLRQGSLDYNISRLERYLQHGDGTNNALANRLLNDAFGGQLDSFGSLYRSGELYEFPLGWPNIPEIKR